MTPTEQLIEWLAEYLMEEVVGVEEQEGEEIKQTA